MAVPKIIPYDVELRSVNPVRSFDRPKAYTNDLKSVEFQFKILDMTSIELNTATAITLVYMRDGSFFANPSTDVERVGNVFSYLLKENEGNHAGVAQIQLVVTIDDAEFASQLFDFEIINGLETKVAQEVMIYDWTTLTRDARAYIDQFVADEVFRDAQFDNAQFDRNITFVETQNQRAADFTAAQDSRTATFNASEVSRTQTFTASEATREQEFDLAEAGRAAGYTADHSRAETDHTIAVDDSEQAATDHLTAVTDHTLADIDHTRAETDHTRADADSATVAGFNTRLTAEEIATVNNKVSAVKGKTFADVDARFEDVETDTTMMGTNLITNGDFSQGTTGWIPGSANLSVIGNTLSVAGNGGSATASASQIPSLLTGSKYYVKAKVRVTNSTCIAIFVGTDINGNSLLIANPVINQWYVVSHIFARTTDTNIRPRHVYADTSTANGKVMEVQYVEAIDLTATFGVGKEPTVEQMDEIMSRFTNSWFDGTKNLFRASEALKKQIAIDARTEFEAKNDVTNGDFSNGTTGWNDSSGASTLSAASGVLTATGKGTAAFFSAHSDITTTPKNGDKIYVRARIRDNLKTTLLQTYLRGGYTSGFISIPSGTGAWQTISCIHTLSSSPTSAVAVAFRPSFASSADQAGSTLDLQYVSTINLTTAFGAGKEPTFAEMDRLMARFPNSWFDGVKPIQTIETLYQEKANKVQEAWITPTLLNGWVAYDAGNTLKYRKNELGKVTLSGWVKSGTVAANVMQLPVGYRPSHTFEFPIIMNGVIKLAYITTTGYLITASDGSNIFAIFDNVSFYTD